MMIKKPAATTKLKQKSEKRTAAQKKGKESPSKTTKKIIPSVAKLPESRTEGSDQERDSSPKPNKSAIVIMSDDDRKPSPITTVKEEREKQSAPIKKTKESASKTTKMLVPSVAKLPESLRDVIDQEKDRDNNDECSNEDTEPNETESVATTEGKQDEQKLKQSKGSDKGSISQTKQNSDEIINLYEFKK